MLVCILAACDLAPSITFNATPTARTSGFTAPAATAATNSTPYGYSQAQADAIVTWIRAVDAELKAKGLIA